jgi:hypothetical protein
VVVGGVETIEKKVWCEMMNGTGRTDVEKMIGSVKGFYPKLRREVGLEKEGADDVVGGADHAFGAPVLRGCIGTRETE